MSVEPSSHADQGLTYCSNCLAAIASTATVCPHCRATFGASGWLPIAQAERDAIGEADSPANRKRGGLSFIGWALVAFGLILLVGNIPPAGAPVEPSTLLTPDPWFTFRELHPLHGKHAMSHEIRLLVYRLGLLAVGAGIILRSIGWWMGRSAARRLDNALIICPEG